MGRCKICGGTLVYSARKDGLGMCHPCARKHLRERCSQLEEALALAQVARDDAEAKLVDMARPSMIVHNYGLKQGDPLVF